MRAPIAWTPEDIARGMEMRAAGMLNKEIAVALNRHVDTIGPKLGRLYKRGESLAPKDRPKTDDERSFDHGYALPAGHPIAWSILTAGTVLDGSAFK